MVGAARLAGISKASKFFGENPAGFSAMELANNARALLLEHAKRAAKNADLSAFDITLKKIRRRIPLIVIESDGWNLNRSSGGSRVHVAQAPVRRMARIAAHETDGACLRPHSYFLKSNVCKFVSLGMLPHARDCFWLRFKSDHFPFWTDQSRRKQGKKSEVRPNIVEHHAGTEMLGQSLLNFRFHGAIEIVSPSSRIQFEPQPLAWAIGYLKPNRRISRHKLGAEPGKNSAENRQPPQATKYRKMPREESKDTFF